MVGDSGGVSGLVVATTRLEHTHWTLFVVEPLRRTSGAGVGASGRHNGPAEYAQEWTGTYPTSMAQKAKRRRPRHVPAPPRPPRSSGDVADMSTHPSWHSFRDAFVTAVGFASAVASLSTLSLATALLATGAIGLALGLLLPHRRVKIALIPCSCASFAVAILLFLGAFETTASPSSSHRYVRSAGDWVTKTPDLASATAVLGVYPGRAARLCGVIAACSTGPVANLDAIVFREGNVFQGVSDERQFLGAQEVNTQEKLHPMLDPLFVRPGETIRVSGVIDNDGEGRHAIAEGVRALIAIPPGYGKRLSLLAAVSSPSTLPTLITDSVVLRSTNPIYLRYEPGTAFATRNTEGVYKLPNALVTEYDPKELDRRLFAGQGPLVGCRSADGVMPPGRKCAIRFQAVFKVAYAAVEEDTNGLTIGLDSYSDEVSVQVRHREELYFSDAPEPGTEAEGEPPRPGRRLPLDCELRRDGTTWYHVASIEEDSGEGAETAFIESRQVTAPSHRLPECLS
jgi:hypothetical protein